MNLKKIIALLLVLIMALTVFTACGKNDENTDVTNENTEAGISEVGLYVDGKKVLGADDIIMTVNGLEIPFDEFRYMYKYIDSTSFSGGDETFWASNADLLPSLLDQAKSYVLEANWGNLLAAKYDITLTDEDLETLDAYMAEQAASFESEEEYHAVLEETGFTEELLRRLVSQELMCYRVYEDLYLVENAPLAPSDDEILETLMNDYRRVHHVLISYDHFQGLEGYEEATEEELKQAALDLANATLTQIQNGESTVYELAQTVGDDPGMLENVDGYFFSYNEMVEEFEKTSFALEVGEISGLVETSFGYHIIERLEQTAYIVANEAACKEPVIINKLYDDVDEILATAEIVYNENYDKITIDSIR